MTASMNPDRHAQDLIHHADVFLQRHDRLVGAQDGECRHLFAHDDAALGYSESPSKEALKEIGTEWNDPGHAMSVEWFQARIVRQIAAHNGRLPDKDVFDLVGVFGRRTAAVPTAGNDVRIATNVQQKNGRTIRSDGRAGTLVCFSHNEKQQSHNLERGAS